MKSSCAICGVETNISPSDKIYGRNKYCSKQCSHLARLKNSKGQNNPSWRGGKVLKICVHCGREYASFKCHANRINNRYCSRKCRATATAKIGPDNYQWGGEISKCIICGKEKHNKQSRVDKGWNKFCGNTCRIIWFKTMPRAKKENHSQWKGGITPANTSIRNTKKYSDWRTSIFKRDNFTCGKCGAVGVKLNAHHIKKFSVILGDIRREYPILQEKDIAEVYPDMWDSGNGITLCCKCHRQEHKSRKLK